MNTDLIIEALMIETVKGLPNISDDRLSSVADYHTRMLVEIGKEQSRRMAKEASDLPPLPETEPDPHFAAPEVAREVVKRRDTERYLSGPARSVSPSMMRLLFADLSTEDLTNSAFDNACARWAARCADRNEYERRIFAACDRAYRLAHLGGGQ